MSASKKTHSAKHAASDGARSSDRLRSESSESAEDEQTSPTKGGDDPPRAPRKRRRRSRRRSSEGPTTPGDASEAGSPIPLDKDGRERPYFLTRFPDDPELERLCSAFEAGDYAFVRQHAEKVARKTDNDEVRRAALELFERIKPDPLIKYMLLVSIGLLLFLVIHAYTSHAH